MSQAAKRKAHKASRRIQSIQPRAKTANVTLVAEQPALRHKTGLEWMVSKKQINRDQLKTGTRYGRDFRLAEVAGMHPLRSCLNDEPGGSGTGAPAKAEGDETARVDLLDARTTLKFHVGMIGACDLICGRGLTPWEALALTGFEPKQRDVEKLRNTLVIALDLLGEHYRLTK